LVGLVSQPGSLLVQS